MSLFRNENPNLGSLSDVQMATGAHVLLAHDAYSIPTPGPNELVFGTPATQNPLVIDPNAQRTYVINAASATTFTLGAPSLGPRVTNPGNGPLADGKIINIWSDTNFAHVISAPGLFLTGTQATPSDFISFNPYAGANVELMAYQGQWLVCGCNVGFGSFVSAPVLGPNATAYAIGAEASITNTGTTTINGSAFLTPGSSITGSPTITGTTDVDNTAATNALAAVETMYQALVALPSNGTLPGSLNLYTVLPGVYTVATSTGTTGASNITFNALGNPNAVFVLQIGTTLTLGAGTTITLLNGAQAKNIFWAVGTSATFAGTGSPQFYGAIYAQVSISLGTSGVSVARFFAGANGNTSGALTFAGGNTVTIPV